MEELELEWRFRNGKMMKISLKKQVLKKVEKVENE